MGKNTIKINSEKLKALCEERGEGLTIYEMPKKYGYSKNLIQGAMAKGEASIVVQNLLLNFNIRKEEYIFEEEKEYPFTVSLVGDSRLLATLTADDLREIIREELKALLGGVKP